MSFVDENGIEKETLAGKNVMSTENTEKWFDDNDEMFLRIDETAGPSVRKTVAAEDAAVSW